MVFKMIVMALVAQLLAVESMQKTTVLFSKAPRFHDDAFNRLDLKLIETFAKQYQLDIEYIPANGTLNEMFGTEDGFEKLFDSIKDFKIDIFIGALEENLITKKYLIASRPYYHDFLTWCIQKSQPIPRWQSIFYMCDANFFVVFTLFAFTAIGAAYYLQKTEPNKKDWFYLTLIALTISIGYPHCYRPKGNPTRVLITIGQFGGIIFYTALITGLLLCVSVPKYMPQIDSIAEIINGNFTLAGDRFALQKLSQQNEKYSTELLQNFKIFSDPNIYLSRLEWDSQLAVAVSREQIRNDEMLSQMHMYCFKNPIYEYPMRVLTTKRFKHLSQLNRFIEMASESGLIGKWLKGIQFGHFGAEKSAPTYTEVDMEVMCVLMIITALLLLFATYVLYIERAMDKREKNQANARIWRMIKMLIDPDRHFFMDDL